MEGWLLVLGTWRSRLCVPGSALAGLPAAQQVVMSDFYG